MKKLISLILAAVMLLSTVGAGGAVAYSATKTYANDKLAEIQTQKGYVPGKTAVVTGNCYAFVSKVCEKLYGVQYNGEGLYGNYHAAHNTGNYKTVATFTTGSKYPTSNDIENIKKFFLENAVPGDIIHYGTLTSSSSNNSTHTVMVQSIDNERLQIYHANYQTVDYDSTDCHIDSLYWSSWKSHPADNTYTSSGHMYSNNRLFYNKMKINGVGISINRYTKYENKYYLSGNSVPAIDSSRTSTTSIRISWEKILGASKYRIQYRKSGAGDYTTASSTVTGISYDVKNLTTGTKYDFRVCAYVGGKWRAYSDVLSLKAMPPKLSALKYSASETGLKLAFSGYSDLTGVRIYRSDKSDGKYKLIKNLTAKNATEYIDTTVKYNQQYYYKFERYKKSGSKEYATMSSVKSAKYVLAVPTVSSYRENSTTLVFNISGDNAQTQFAYYLKDSKNKTVVQSSTEKNSVKVKNLSTGEKYTFYCAEKNKFGTGAYTSHAKQALPASSSNTSVIDTSSGLLVTFETTDDTDGYYIYRSTSPNGSYSKVGTVSTPEIGSFLDTTVKYNTYYYYKTKRYVIRNKKEYQSVLSAKSSEGAKIYLDKPQGVSVTKISPTSFKVKWKSVEKATSYLVYYKEVGGKWQKLSNPVSQNYATITGLKTGKDYYIRIYANNRIGHGESSDDKTYTALPQKMSAPTAKISSSGIKVQWTKEKSITGYKIYRKDSKNGSYKLVKTITSASAASWTDKSVKNNKGYYYKIRCYKTVSKKDYNGSYSSEIYCKYALAKPTSVTVTKNGATSVRLKWKSVPGASKYVVSYKYSGGKTVTKTVNSADTLITSMSRGKKYTLSVKATSSVGSSAYSNSVSIKL